MNHFMNALYQNGDGCAVTGYYRDVPFAGKIVNVRCTYGDGLNVYVDLDDAIVIAGHARNALVLDGKELFDGAGAVTKNLHVYF